jgi:hypothetical protein
MDIDTVADISVELEKLVDSDKCVQVLEWVSTAAAKVFVVTKQKQQRKGTKKRH